MKRLGVNQIEASGTRSASTFLCGNGTWAAPGGVGGGSGGPVAIDWTTLAANTPVATGTWSPLDTATDLVLPASAGDLIEVQLSGRVESETPPVYQDVYSMVGGAPVNSLGLNAAALTGSTGTGVIPWVGDSGVGHPSGSIFYVVTTSDLNAGQVTIRWYARRAGTSGSKSVSGGSRLHAVNWGGTY